MLVGDRSMCGEHVCGRMHLQIPARWSIIYLHARSTMYMHACSLSDLGKQQSMFHFTFCTDNLLRPCLLIEETLPLCEEGSAFHGVTFCMHLLLKPHAVAICMVLSVSVYLDMNHGQEPVLYLPFRADGNIFYVSVGPNQQAVCHCR